MLSFNDFQKEAVETIDQQVLVLAGAGSGKTRVIAGKTVFLVNEKKVSPRHILAITFTNKAASEMRERIESYLPNNAEPKQKCTVKTFHSFGAFFLRLFIAKLEGYSGDFTILDDTDQRKLLAEILKDSDPQKKTTKSFANLISDLKNNLLYPKDKNTSAFIENNYKLFDALEKYKEYQNHLKAHNLVDFDDLIAFPIKVLEASQDARNY